MVDFLGPLIGIAEHVPGLASKAFARRVNRALASLMYWSDGTIQPLQRMSSGNGSQADLDEIAHRLRTSQREVEKAAIFLRSNRHRIAAAFGAGMAHRVDAAVESKMGTNQVRDMLRFMVEGHDYSAHAGECGLREVHCVNAIIKEIEIRPL